jgi:hypothetical protein
MLGRRVESPQRLGPTGMLTKLSQNESRPMKSLIGQYIKMREAANDARTCGESGEPIDSSVVAILTLAYVLGEKIDKAGRDIAAAAWTPRI